MLGKVAHICNPSTGEMGTGRSLELVVKAKLGSQASYFMLSREARILSASPAMYPEAKDHGQEYVLHWLRCRDYIVPSRAALLGVR